MWDRARFEVSKGSNGADIDAFGKGIDFGSDQAGVDGADDKIFEVASGGKRECFLEIRVGEEARRG